jgi:hypothetical protein
MSEANDEAIQKKGKANEKSGLAAPNSAALRLLR